MSSSSDPTILPPASSANGDEARGTSTFEPSRDRFTKELQQKAASHKRRNFDNIVMRFSSEESEELFNWYIFAGYVNPAAAMHFQEAATILRAAQGKYTHTGNYAAPGVPKDVLGYLLGARAAVFRRLEDDAQDCERPNPLYFKPGTSMETLCQNVDALRVNLADILEKLKVSLASEFVLAKLPDTELCHWWDSINPDPAYRSIVQIVLDLQPLSVRLWRIYEKRKAEAETPNVSKGLRRRRPANVDSANQAQDPPASDVSPTRMEFMLELFDTAISTVRRIDPLVTQETLWVITFISITISAAVSGYSIALKADTLPKLSNDPNFFTLLSQAVIQWLSLYSAIVPVLRKNVERRTVWFPVCLGISALASLMAPIVYPFTWEGASMLNYLSAATSLIVSVFLTGNIEAMASKNALPGNGRRSQREP